MSNWKDVKGYEGLYLVSDKGEVLALPRTKRIRNGGLQPLPSRILKPAGRSSKCRMPNCHPHVNLVKDGVRKSYFVHRLVAEAFIPNPDNLPFINHKDHNTWNNDVSNLGWCTRQYNNEYSNDKAVEQYGESGGFINRFKSIKEAAQCVGISQNAISGALHGRQKTAAGYLWKFAEEA